MRSAKEPARRRAARTKLPAAVYFVKAAPFPFLTEIFAAHKNARRARIAPETLSCYTARINNTGRYRTMIREIMKDRVFLARKSEPAAMADMPVAQDLLETLAAHADECVGMAANMIGVNKRIIAFAEDGRRTVLFNPEIVRKSGPYTAQEGCLSLDGIREAQRFHKIQVRFQDERFRPRMKTFDGWTAQIIQHEIDHCDGVLI